MQLIRTTPNRLQTRRSNVPSSLFDDLFDDFFGPVFANRRMVSAPVNAHLQVDIYEKDNTVVIEAEMPGVAKEDISVDVKGRQLTLKAERKRETEVKEEHSLRMERSYGSIERSFTMPFEVNSEQVSATLTNGVLRLEISKPEEQQRKQITIN